MKLYGWSSNFTELSNVSRIILELYHIPSSLGTLLKFRKLYQDHPETLLKSWNLTDHPQTLPNAKNLSKVWGSSSNFSRDPSSLGTLLNFFRWGAITKRGVRAQKLGVRAQKIFGSAWTLDKMGHDSTKTLYLISVI